MENIGQRKPANVFASQEFSWLTTTVKTVTVLAVCFIVISFSAFAQTSQSITGVVADSTGAVIPKATVVVHNDDTGVDKTVVVSSSGSYTAPFLIPGKYSVLASAAGFKPVNKTDLTLVTGQALVVNFALTVGTQNETVTINAAADVLDYSKPDRGDVVERTRITELPILAGDPFNIAELSAGAVSTLALGSYEPYNQTGQSLSIHNQAVEFNVDGLSNLSMTGAQNYAYDPPNDTLQEFKITTNAFDAAAGRSAGGAIDMTLKSGTQKLHGDVRELLRRGFLDANSSNNNASIQKNGNLPLYQRPPHTENHYGFEVDGPLIVPKLIHGNKQAFFVLAYDYDNNLTGGAVTESLPTAAMLNGDYSAFLSANGAAFNQPIYDPLSESSCTANNTDNGSYANKNPHVCRYQFGYGPGVGPGPQGNPVPTGPANVIPTSRLNPVAQSVLSWYALPNQAPTATTANDFSNNYSQNNPTTSIYRNYLGKLTFNRGTSDIFNLSAQIWTQFGTSINGSPRNNVNPTHPGVNWAAYGAHFTSHYKEPSYTMGWTHTFNSNLVNSFKLGVLVTSQTDNTGPQAGFDPSSLGFPEALTQANSQYFQRFPSMNIGNYYVLGSIAGLLRGDTGVVLNDTVNLVRKNHTMHFGIDFRPYQYSQRISNAAGNSINLNVAKGWTQQWDTNVTGGATSISTPAGYSGNSVASFQLGTLDSGNAQYQPNNYYSNRYLALFFNDDWKVNNRLTLNLGMRWEYPGTGNTDRMNRQVAQFDGTDVNPINSLVSPSSIPGGATLLGGITYAGVNGRMRAPFQKVWDDFGPRAGFAYILNQKTVVRGGIGVYYNDAINGNSQSSPQTGYTSNTIYTGTPDGGATPLQNLSNPFPTVQVPTGNCGGALLTCLQTNAGQTLSFYNPTYRPPIILQSAVSVERQFTAHDSIEIAYAGSRGYNGAYSDDLNHVSAAAEALCDPERNPATTLNPNGGQQNCTSQTLGYVANPFKGLAPFAASGNYYSAATIQKINFSRPYPIFTSSSPNGSNISISENNLNGTHSWYNAGEVTLNHRVSAGITLHATYTYSKAMNTGNIIDYVNRISARTLSGTDNPHRITVSGIYQIPIGRNRMLFSHMNRVLDLAVGGWQVANVFTYQSGMPFGISGYEIDSKANGGYILPRKRFYPSATNPYWTGKYNPTNSYIQAFKPCVGTRDPNTGVVTLEAYSTAAGCGAANFIQTLTYGVVPNVEYTGIRLQRLVDLDLNASKNFMLVERLNMVFQLRLDAFNSLNHIENTTSGYDTSVTDSNFGTLQLGTALGSNLPNRQVQISGRLSF
jgi:Carboxypeptidase regulatory-like domain